MHQNKITGAYFVCVGAKSGVSPLLNRVPFFCRETQKKKIFFFKFVDFQFSIAQLCFIYQLLGIQQSQEKNYKKKVPKTGLLASLCIT